MEDDEAAWPFGPSLANEDGDDDDGLVDGAASGRLMCPSCERPARVCWCAHVPDPPLQIASRVVILQHPNETRRGIRTALMAARGIGHNRCQIVKGRKFSLDSHADLLGRPRTYLLYPGPEATPVAELPAGQGPYTFVLLDGTWDEARKLFARNAALQALPRVSLATGRRSCYVVRTQPADFCLSTVETVAETLALVEKSPDLVERLLGPLHAMCHAQIRHGAVEHDSQQFKEQNGQFDKKNQWKKNKKLSNNRGTAL